ncbi:MAG: NTPase [Candidatus Bipolaricaulota bacterium]
MRVAVSGHPGVGKTTFVQGLAAALPLRVGGIVTQEIRVVGRRVGFTLKDLATGEEGILAHLHHAQGPQLGRYRVHTHDLEEIGAAAIERAAREAELVVIDEVGPMELTSERFVQAVRKALHSDTHLLVTVHRSSKHSLTYVIRQHVDHHLHLSYRNRDRLLEYARGLFLASGGNSTPPR